MAKVIHVDKDKKRFFGSDHWKAKFEKHLYVSTMITTMCRQKCRICKKAWSNIKTESVHLYIDSINNKNFVCDQCKLKLDTGEIGEYI